MDGGAGRNGVDITQLQKKHHSIFSLSQLSSTRVFSCPSSSDSSSGSYMYHDEVMDEAGVAKPKVPLDEEWTVLAKKMLKGGDPEKKLTWRTAEVSLTVV